MWQVERDVLLARAQNAKGSGDELSEEDMQRLMQIHRQLQREEASHAQTAAPHAHRLHSAPAHSYLARRGARANLLARACVAHARVGAARRF